MVFIAIPRTHMYVSITNNVELIVFPLDVNLKGNIREVAWFMSAVLTGIRLKGLSKSFDCLNAGCL